MKIVADTSIIIAVIANETQKPLIIQKTQGLDLIAPYSLKWEIGNAFSAMIKRGRITLQQAESAIEIFDSMHIELVDLDLTKAMHIVAKLNVYAYDAYMIACALENKCPLITLDSGLAYAAKEVSVSICEVE
jgi:predicted nucleic acid-binding protein